MEALVDAGMTWPEIIDATDDETQHKVFGVRDARWKG